ncbi:MAG: nucleotidyltransferase domain-containing protein [Candidatus Omnitrophica bacterium]|nr:nucleotidyltransferase domain-containing protein [Candidatus Omnitrophota bacterium]
MNRERLKRLLAELKRGLKTIYGGRLKGVYLFGSYARQEQDSESDVDILVVLDRFSPTYSAEINRVGDLGSELSLKYGVSISKVFVKERDWANKETPFLDNVREEAIAA